MDQMHPREALCFKEATTQKKTTESTQPQNTPIWNY